MEDEYVLHRCVTEFMLNTCRCTKGSDRGYLDVISRYFGMTAWKGAYDAFLSGSHAELYITPMLSCIGDMDIMLCYNNCLAIPAGHPPPTELPTQFLRRVTVYEIIDSHQPGYIYLKPSYVLKKTNGCHYKSSKLTTTILCDLHGVEYSVFFPSKRHGFVGSYEIYYSSNERKYPT